MPNLIAFKITDAAGRAKSAVFPVNSDATVTEMNAFVSQIAPLVDNCIDGILSAATVTIALSLPGGLGSTPADDKLVEDGGLLAFDAADTDYRSSIWIPAIADTAVDNYKTIANAGSIATLVTAILSGTNCNVQDKHSNALTAFLSGKRTYRK